MGAWVGVVGIVIGVILAEGIRWLRDWREGKEKYRVMLYGKRLEVHQQAFHYVTHLKDTLDNLRSNDVSDLEKVRVLYEEARQFYDSTCLYLDERSRVRLLLTFSAIKFYLAIPNGDNKEETCRRLRNTQRAIEIGIGMKHIDQA